MLWLSIQEHQYSLPVACLSKDLLYFCAHKGFVAIFSFVKIPTAFHNGSILLHVWVVIPNITTQPSLASYTKATEKFWSIKLYI